MADTGTTAAAARRPIDCGSGAAAFAAMEADPPNPDTHVATSFALTSPSAFASPSSGNAENVVPEFRCQVWEVGPVNVAVAVKVSSRFAFAGDVRRYHSRIEDQIRA
ncbi:MAG: hypothetical protein JNL18_23345 [Planctomycetaceae bacterium]|uniref:hypothetical protein n=1 Tax=Lacipirellula limnantheis TaxID=2528024 RepID=UPI0011A321FD|nr:hypothetical protein [Lacipirellula limnantheis]MBL9165678.1 hypothetical protein [Planctomycetaceae bacterium]